jgi:hypothetical protein
MYVTYVGKLFLQMLKALILPLIIPSLVAAVGSLDMSLSGKVRFVLTHLRAKQLKCQVYYEITENFIIWLIKSNGLSPRSFLIEYEVCCLLPFAYSNQLDLVQKDHIIGFTVLNKSSKVIKALLLDLWSIENVD